jgi:hypothetical protein
LEGLCSTSDLDLHYNKFAPWAFVLPKAQVGGAWHDLARQTRPLHQATTVGKFGIHYEFTRTAGAGPIERHCFAFLLLTAIAYYFAGKLILFIAGVVLLIRGWLLAKLSLPAHHDLLQRIPAWPVGRWSCFGAT